MTDSADDLIAWERLRRDTGRTNALGPLRAAAERREADQERTIRLAADTLLDKALHRVADEPAARRLVDRALRLSVDGDEPGGAGALAVHLFVWDALRTAALDGGRPGGGQPGGATWLDRVEAIGLDGPAREEWHAALRALLAEGELEQAEQRRIRLLAGRGGDHEPFDGVPHEARVTATLELLRALRDLTA